MLFQLGCNPVASALSPAEPHGNTGDSNICCRVGLRELGEFLGQQTYLVGISSSFRRLYDVERNTMEIPQSREFAKTACAFGFEYLLFGNVAGGQKLNDT
jgi:hypothetical protein